MPTIYRVTDYANHNEWVDGKGKAEKQAREVAKNVVKDNEVNVLEHKVPTLNVSALAVILNQGLEGGTVVYRTKGSKKD